MQAQEKTEALWLQDEAKKKFEAGALGEAFELYREAAAAWLVSLSAVSQAFSFRAPPGAPSSPQIAPDCAKIFIATSSGQPVRRNQRVPPEPSAFRAGAFFFSAQRFFIAAAMRLRAAGLMRRLVGPAVARAGTADLDRRAAQRAFIASDRRRLPAAVIPLPRLDTTAAVLCVGLVARPPSARARIALSIRSRSLFNSETILFKSNRLLLQVFFIPLA
jgi:hypothetical protein